MLASTHRPEWVVSRHMVRVDHRLNHYLDANAFLSNCQLSWKPLLAELFAALRFISAHVNIADPTLLNCVGVIMYSSY
jgi:hypothetical protein